MSTQVCTVTGTILDPSGTGVIGVTVSADSLRPVIYPDGSMVINYQVSTTSDVSGAWTLNLLETETPAVSITITFQYPIAIGAQADSRRYSVVVPNTPTALFSTLLTATQGTQV